MRARERTFVHHRGVHRMRRQAWLDTSPLQIFCKHNVESHYLTDYCSRTELPHAHCMVLGCRYGAPGGSKDRRPAYIHRTRARKTAPRRSAALACPPSSVVGQTRTSSRTTGGPILLRVLHMHYHPVLLQPLPEVKTADTEIAARQLDDNNSQQSPPLNTRHR